MNKMPRISKDIRAFIDNIAHKTRRQDAEKLLSVFEEATGEPPKFWPPSAIGFGEHHYRYESGREGDSPNVCFVPRKTHLVLSVLGTVGADHPLLKKLGKHKAGKSCLYINKLADVDLSTLKKIIRLSYDNTVKKYG